MNKSFEKDAIVFYAMTMITSFTNYSFQILSGRLLSIAGFGTLNFLISLVTVFTIPCVAIRMSISKGLTQYKNSDSRISTFTAQVFVYSTAITIAFALSGLALTALFVKENSWAIISAIVISAVMYYHYIASGIAQGYQRFMLMASIGLIFAGVKLLSLGLCLFFPAQVHMQLIVYAMLAGAVISFILGYAILAHRSAALSPKRFRFMRSESLFSLRYTLKAFLANACVIFMMDIDMIFIKLTNSEYIAGLYSPAMIFARMMVYAIISLGTVIFPTVARQSLNGGDTLNTYKKAIAYSLALLIPGSIGVYCLREFLITMLFGQAYLPGAQHVLPACALALSISLCTINMHYLLALNKTYLLIITQALGCAVAVLVAFFVKHNINMVIMAFCACFLAVFVINCAYILVAENSSKK